MGQELTIKNVNKSFEVNGEKINVLNDINLDIKEGEFVVLVGHSGCGKSTLLKIIAGLEKNDTGLVAAGGQEITEPAADRGMIFQEHRLFPWMSIERNVQLGLKGLAREEKKKLSDQYLELVKLSEFKKAYPRQLSGGMSQRAAIARALATQPKILLLDEPFGALDALTKIELQEELLKIRSLETILLIISLQERLSFTSPALWPAIRLPFLVSPSCTAFLKPPSVSASRASKSAPLFSISRYFLDMSLRKTRIG